MNQIEHVATHPLPPFVYFTVVEGPNHYFVAYSFYHPVDYKAVFGHENDLEGILLTIEKTGDGWGRFVVMETLAHNEFYQYYSDQRVRDALDPGNEDRGYEDRDFAVLPKLVVDNGVVIAERPEVIVEAKGHGAFALGHRLRLAKEYIIYKPKDLKDQVSPAACEGTYRILDVFGNDGLWVHKDDASLLVNRFKNWNGKDREQNPQQRLFGAFRGRGPLLKNAANPPWAWDDWNDADPVQRGDWFIVPAFALAHHLQVPQLSDLQVNKPGFYDLFNPFLSAGKNNPPFQKMRMPGPAPAYRAQGDELRKWAKAPDVIVSDRRGIRLRLPAPLPGTKPNRGSVLERDKLNIPLEERTDILLRYVNPPGVPAAKLSFTIEFGRGEPPHRREEITRWILLPSLSSQPVVPTAENFQDSTNEALAEFPIAMQDARLASLRVEFMGDVRALEGDLPELVRSQRDRYLQTMSDPATRADQYLEIWLLEIQTGSPPPGALMIEQSEAATFNPPQ